MRYQYLIASVVPLWLLIRLHGTLLSWKEAFEGEALLCLAIVIGGIVALPMTGLLVSAIIACIEKATNEPSGASLYGIGICAPMGIPFVLVTWFYANGNNATFIGWCQSSLMVVAYVLSIGFVLVKEFDIIELLRQRRETRIRSSAAPAKRKRTASKSGNDRAAELYEHATFCRRNGEPAQAQRILEQALNVKGLTDKSLRGLIQLGINLIRLDLEGDLAKLEIPQGLPESLRVPDGYTTAMRAIMAKARQDRLPNDDEIIALLESFDEYTRFMLAQGKGKNKVFAECVRGLRMALSINDAHKKASWVRDMLDLAYRYQSHARRCDIEEFIDLEQAALQTRSLLSRNDEAELNQIFGIA